MALDTGTRLGPYEIVALLVTEEVFADDKRLAVARARIASDIVLFRGLRKQETA